MSPLVLIFAAVVVLLLVCWLISLIPMPAPSPGNPAMPGYLKTILTIIAILFCIFYICSVVWGGRHGSIF
jgi:hypothetical protein